MGYFWLKRGNEGFCKTEPVESLDVNQATHSHSTKTPTNVFFKSKLMFKITLLELLTPCNGFLEKLTCSQLAKKFLSFYITRRFIAAFTSVRHLSLSEPDQSSLCPLPYVLKIRFNIILPSTPGFTKTLYTAKI